MNLLNARWAIYGKPAAYAVLAIGLAGCTTTESYTTLGGRTTTTQQTLSDAGLGAGIGALIGLGLAATGNSSAGGDMLLKGVLEGAAYGTLAGVVYNQVFGGSAAQPVQQQPQAPQAQRQPTEQEIYSMTSLVDGQGRTWVRRANYTLPSECRDTDNWGREWSLDPNDCYAM